MIRNCCRCGVELVVEVNWSKSRAKINRYICTDCYNKANRERYKTDPRQTMLQKARARAKKANVPFNLTVEDIVIPESCPVLGIPILVASNGKHHSDNSPSLDKIIPELGYVRGNVEVISWRANTLKRDATLAELTAITKWLDSKTLTTA